MPSAVAPTAATGGNLKGSRASEIREKILSGGMMRSWDREKRTAGSGQ
jgi:hypothetical protein